MKKKLAKIRNKRLKGNISLLVILILLASSVISLLSINQIQRLLTYGNMTFNYFRAFYLAKAGTELGLTEVYNSGDGLKHTVTSGDSIVTGNLLSAYSGFNPYFDMDIIGRFQVLNGNIREPNQCSGDNKIILAPGAGIMLSLFFDDTGKKGIREMLSDNDKKHTNLDNFKELSLKEYNYGSELTFALFTYNDNGDEMTNIVVATGKDLGNFLEDKTIDNNQIGYLTIKNSGNEEVQFCITMDENPIPYSDFLITTFGHYGDMEVGLQSIVKKGVPDWTLNVLGDKQ